MKSVDRHFHKATTDTVGTASNGARSACGGRMAQPVPSGSARQDLGQALRIGTRGACASTLLVAVALCAAVVPGSRAVAEEPEFFLLRPDVERAYGYSHAVKIGNDIKVSGAVSMDDAGNPTAVGDLEAQMRNVYADLEQVLQHYGYSFDDVTVERVYTTDMATFLEVSAYRASIYTTQFPTGSWVEVQGLALPEFMIEIELEAYKSN